MTTAAQLLAAELGKLLIVRNQRVSTAESCTGGLIAAALTDIPGSSEWFDAGFVTYSNEAKAKMLGVPFRLIAEQGAVSSAVVEAMAAGARVAAHADWAVAVSGVAGPGGGSPDKPVGMVWFGWAGPNGVASEVLHLNGDRATVRSQSVQHALQGLIHRMEAAE